MDRTGIASVSVAWTDIAQINESNKSVAVEVHLVDPDSFTQSCNFLQRYILWSTREVYGAPVILVSPQALEIEQTELVRLLRSHFVESRDSKLENRS